jgi:hypothetical protein
MPRIDDFVTFERIVANLREEFPERSTIEIATAVLDASAHGVTRAYAAPGSLERSARHRLAAPLAVPHPAAGAGSALPGPRGQTAIRSGRSAASR